MRERAYPSRRYRQPVHPDVRRYISGCVAGPFTRADRDRGPQCVMASPPRRCRPEDVEPGACPSGVLEPGRAVSRCACLALAQPPVPGRCHDTAIRLTPLASRSTGPFGSRTPLLRRISRATARHPPDRANITCFQGGIVRVRRRMGSCARSSSRHCERSEAIQSVAFLAKIKVFRSQRRRGAEGSAPQAFSKPSIASCAGMQI